jgi:pilus assembly protein FimV
MKKTLIWITWLSLSAVSPIALAVGLGQVSVSSYLNAPLDASMPLLESSDYALNDIRVSVAEQFDFAAQGLEWTPLADNVRAQVQEQQGRRQVRLSTERPIDEPWLELLLTIEYPGGQQSREVTMLFDPQGYAQNDTQGAASAPRVTEQPSVAARPASAATSPRGSDNRTNGSSGNSGKSAYVGSGDTLWGVAERIKPVDVSVQQMMIALLDANPEVFPTGNIHEMRAGQTLRVPDIGGILARSYRDADAAIKAMNEAWRTRRNGSLQAVPLPDVEIAPVSEASISAAQTLQANVAADPDSALTAGGLEAGESVADGLAAIEEEPEQPEALTRAELTEQLRLSQATLQQVLEERELMRAELNALRGEVASLTMALSSALAAQEQASTPLAASMSENQSVGALIARYQWPLALAAIALLLGLLVWLRNRREETWDDVSFAEPVIRPTVSPSATPPPDRVSTTHLAQQHNAEAEAGRPHEESERQTEADADVFATNAVLPMDPDQWLVDDQGLELRQDDTLSYDKSPAAGLAEQGPHRRIVLHAVPDNSAENVSLAPPQSSVPMSRMLVSLVAGLQASDPAASDAHVQEIDSPLEATEDARHRFIDYHPPILNSALSSNDGLRTETPMQPTVEFATESLTSPAKKPRRPMEEEWEIEEVAFKPRGLDNSKPSKSSK